VARMSWPATRTRMSCVLALASSWRATWVRSRGHCPFCPRRRWNLSRSCRRPASRSLGVLFEVSCAEVPARALPRFLKWEPRAPRAVRVLTDSEMSLPSFESSSLTSKSAASSSSDISQSSTGRRMWGGGSPACGSQDHPQAAPPRVLRVLRPGPDFGRIGTRVPDQAQIGNRGQPRFPAPANRESGLAPIPGQIGTQIGAGNRGVTSLSG
jgi:hypothetical protein